MTMASTLFTRDYLGRILANTEPGVSNVTDYLGRQINDPSVAPNDETDFYGRTLRADDADPLDGLPYVLPFQL